AQRARVGQRDRAADGVGAVQLPPGAAIDGDRAEAGEAGGEPAQRAGGAGGARGQLQRVAARAALHLAIEHRPRVDDQPVRESANELHRIDAAADGAGIRHGARTAADVDAEIAGATDRAGVGHHAAVCHPHAVEDADYAPAIADRAEAAVDVDAVMAGADDRAGVDYRAAGIQAHAAAVDRRGAADDAAVGHRRGGAVGADPVAGALDQRPRAGIADHAAGQQRDAVLPAAGVDRAGVAQAAAAGHGDRRVDQAGVAQRARVAQQDAAADGVGAVQLPLGAAVDGDRAETGEAGGEAAQRAGGAIALRQLQRIAPAAARDLADEDRPRIYDHPIGERADELHRAGGAADRAGIRHGARTAADVDPDIGGPGDHAPGRVADRAAGEQDHAIGLAGDRAGIGHAPGRTPDPYGVVRSADRASIIDRSAGFQIDTV